MNFTLTRNAYLGEGIFGEWKDDDTGLHTFANIEHSFNCVAKLASGVYTMKRGLHELHGLALKFETFMVLNPPDFDGKPVSGILIHWGNYNRDSEGCSCIGLRRDGVMVLGSKLAFAAFMTLQKGLDTWQLTVVDTA